MPRQEPAEKTEAELSFRRRTDDPPANAQLHYGAEMFSDGIDSSNLGIHSRVYGAGYADYELHSPRRFSLSAGLRA